MAMGLDCLGRALDEVEALQAIFEENCAVIDEVTLLEARSVVESGGASLPAASSSTESSLACSRWRAGRGRRGRAGILIRKSIVMMCQCSQLVDGAQIHCAAFVQIGRLRCSTICRHTGRLMACVECGLMACWPRL